VRSKDSSSVRRKSLPIYSDEARKPVLCIARGRIETNCCPVYCTHTIFDVRRTRYLNRNQVEEVHVPVGLENHIELEVSSVQSAPGVPLGASAVSSSIKSQR
jgi:hypothetical protein